MPIILDLSPEAAAFKDSVQSFCEQVLGSDVLERRAVGFSRALWQQLAELGLFEIAGTDMEDALLLACIGTGVLGYHGFPGPVPHTIAASAVPGPAWDAQASGARIVTIGAAPLVAWAEIADDVICLEADTLRSAVVGPAVATLGRTRAADVTAGAPLTGDGVAVRARYDMASAAYVAGAGRFLVDAAAEHARTRRQFGRAIGEFQAVAYPLAEALMLLDSAELLARGAARALDARRDDAPAIAGAARLSASRAALKASFAAHQVFGAYGVLDDGPVGWLSRRIQELATLAPSVRQTRSGLPLDIAAALSPDLWPVAESI
ncbi:acyl-CoA dehydrogenase family protein [Sphingomonas sp. CJ20]